MGFEEHRWILHHQAGQSIGRGESREQVLPPTRSGRRSPHAVARRGLPEASRRDARRSRTHSKTRSDHPAVPEDGCPWDTAPADPDAKQSPERES